MNALRQWVPALGVMVVLSGVACGAEDTKQKLFQRVFGDRVKLDAAVVAKVKALPAGKRHAVDTNADGKPDEVWFIDTSARHQDRAKPVLVRIIDEDKDMTSLLTGDFDSDLYVADWKADGKVDVVLDYQDNDGDNDLDEMGIYYYTAKDHFLGKPALRVWWGRDDGDDNLLWYDVNYTYQQGDCQWRTHFSGDEVFVAFGLPEGGDHWVSIWENPFAFYDPDKDGCSEVVIRYQALADEVEALRYSFDIDNDAFGRRTHDYDFSISGVAAGSRWFRKDKGPGSDLKMPTDLMEETKIRGIRTGKFMSREHAQPWAIKAAWDRTVLTWDEIDSNTDGNWKGTPNERWEGVIAHPSKNFPQIGGPTCGAINKRNEVSVKPALPMRLYWDPTDHRLHLAGATEGWIDVDYDIDGKVDMKYVYVDSDKNGYFDRRQIDLDADGTPEFDWAMHTGDRMEIPPDFRKLNAFYVPKLTKVIADTQRFIDIAKAALGDPEPDPVESCYLDIHAKWTGAEWIGDHIRKSPAGSRYYLDLIRDRLLGRLEARLGSKDGWKAAERSYAQGDYADAADAVAALAGGGAADKATAAARAYSGFTKRVAVRLPSRHKRVGWPVTIALKDIVRAAPDFVAGPVAVVAGDRWIAWREIQHQIDGIDSEVGRELSFLADLDPDAENLYYVYFDMAGGGGGKSFPHRTATAMDWVPPNIGWESERLAWRAYWGQFDFFGKKVDRLILNSFGAKSYHDEIDWGIDALLVGTNSGSGGVTLYVGDKAHVAQKPAGKGDVEVSKKVVVSGPVRSVVSMTATNVVSDQPSVNVTLTCMIYAGREETAVRAVVKGIDGSKPLALAPGLTRLVTDTSFVDKRAGVFGVWGEQTPVIGEIGMAVTFDPARCAGTAAETDERRVKLSIRPGEPLDYVLTAEWRRGMQHPVGVGSGNWEKAVRQLAELYAAPVQPKISKSENVR